MPDQDDFALRAVRDWAAVLPTLDVSPDELSIAIRLSRLSNLQNRIDDQALRAYESRGIRGSDDFRTVAMLRRAPHPGLTNSEILDQLGGSKAGVSTRLDRFIDRGLCVRIPSPIDRRSHTNELTDDGRGLADELVSAVVKGRQTLLSALSPKQISDLAHTLAIMIETVDPHD